MTKARLAFPCGSDGKESTCDAGDLGSIPGLVRAPGGGHGGPPQCSFLENPMDGGACWVTVHGVAEPDTTGWLNTAPGKVGLKFESRLLQCITLWNKFSRCVSPVDTEKQFLRQCRSPPRLKALGNLGKEGNAQLKDVFRTYSSIMLSEEGLTLPTRVMAKQGGLHHASAA